MGEAQPSLRERKKLETKQRILGVAVSLPKNRDPTIPPLGRWRKRRTSLERQHLRQYWPMASRPVG